jgi:WD40 repeat protein
MAFYSALDSFVGSIFLRAAATSGGIYIEVWWFRDGSIVSGDSSGSTQFWDGKQGTLIQVQTRHNADVLALAASPDHRSVFSAGADGQVPWFPPYLSDTCLQIIFIRFSESYERSSSKTP